MQAQRLREADEKIEALGRFIFSLLAIRSNFMYYYYS